MLLELKASFDQLVSERDITRCIKLRKLYLKARDRSLPDRERVEVLLDSLLVASSYEERLISMKISCRSIFNKVSSLYEKKKNFIVQEDNFYKKKKCDQDHIIAQKTEKLSIFIDDIDNYISIINDSIEYVRSVEFNIKSILNTLKEYLHGNQ